MGQEGQIAPAQSAFFQIVAAHESIRFAFARWMSGVRFPSSPPSSSPESPWSQRCDWGVICACEDTERTVYAKSFAGSLRSRIFHRRHGGRNRRCSAIVTPSQRLRGSRRGSGRRVPVPDPRTRSMRSRGRCRRVRGTRCEGSRVALGAAIGEPLLDLVLWGGRVPSPDQIREPVPSR